MKKLKQVLIFENMLLAFLSRPKVSILLLLFLLRTASSVKLPEEWKMIIKRTLEAWMKNPECFPYRVHGTYFGSLQRVYHKIPDIVMWDPLTQFEIDLVCPSCEEPRTLLRLSSGRMGRHIMTSPECCFPFKGK